MIYLNIHSIKINVFIEKNRKNYIEKISIMVIFDKNVALIWLKEKHNLAQLV